VVPRSLFRASRGIPVNPRVAAESFPAHQARVGAACNIAMRVGWNGDPAQLGNVDVDTALGWCPVYNLDIENGVNDLIFPAVAIEGAALMVDFERGPEHVQRAFKVRAIAIKWRADMSFPDQPDASFVAVRHRDYEYSQEPDSVPWLVSEPTLSDGVHRATLSLPKGVSHEIWIAIQHPTDDDCWKDHDPVMRPGTGEPGQE
jgi:hypothetical protein